MPLSRLRTTGTSVPVRPNQVRGASAAECRLDQLRLLALMDLERADRWGSARVAADIGDVVPHPPESRLHERPPAHVLRFLLDPDDLRLLVATKRRAELSFREGV